MSNERDERKAEKYIPNYLGN